MELKFVMESYFSMDVGQSSWELRRLLDVVE